MAVKANYETVMVLSTKLGDEGVSALVEKFKALVEKHATLLSVDEWGKRKLAYLINKESEGYYVLMNFESEADFPAELDRIYKITDGVMRSLIIKKENPDLEPKKAVKAEKVEETKPEVKAEPEAKSENDNEEDE